MTDDLIECYSNSKKLQPFVHLPIQSGSNKILKLMNRGHEVEKYLDIYGKLKKINSKIEFSSDFIIGHPGETEEDFNDTLNFLNEIKFINSYSFIFSPRPGTPASNLDLIDHEVAKDRLIKVQKILFQYQLEHNESFLGKKIDVLVENRMKKNQMYFGRNKYLNGVIFDGNDKLIGQTVKIKIDKVNQNNLFGKIDSKSDMKAA
jgi:tRNA-2-methylthio-N6-dimethylallyladenosine synthase